MYYFDGASWESQIVGTGAILNDVDAYTANVVWACSATGSSYNFNGISWNRVSTGNTRFLRSVDILDPTHVWMVGDRGTVLFYDGSILAVGSNGAALHKEGLDWSEVSIPGDPTLWDLDSHPSGIVDGTLLQWDDGSWSEANSDTTLDLFGLDILNSGHAWAVGGGSDGGCTEYVISTLDSGSWTSMHVGDG